MTELAITMAPLPQSVVKKLEVQINHYPKLLAELVLLQDIEFPHKNQVMQITEILDDHHESVYLCEYINRFGGNVCKAVGARRVYITVAVNKTNPALLIPYAIGVRYYDSTDEKACKEVQYDSKSILMALRSITQFF